MQKVRKILKFFKLKNLRADIIAGMSVAFIMIPQSMAYAKLAGLPIHVGLYTSFIPVMVAALFGSTGRMSTGPVTIISLMTATALYGVASANPEGYVIYASILALFIGVFYLLLGILRMGVIVDFLSHPVIIGFTNGVALITLISQLPKIFGVSVEKGSNFFIYSYTILEAAINGGHLITFIFGILSIVFLLALKWLYPKLPRVLLLLVVTIIGSYYFGYSNIGGSIVGNIPAGLPSFSVPLLSEQFRELNLGQIRELAIFAIIIGLIGFTETISVAKFVGIHTREKVRANKELIGQGFANISSGLTGGYGVAGSFSKTAVNLRAGAKTYVSSITTGIIVGFTLLFLTPLLYHLPNATLAAIIIVAVSNLIKVKPVIKSWSIKKDDGVVSIITFVLTLMLAPQIEMAIIIGVALSMTLFIYRTMRPSLIQVARYKDGVFRDIEKFGLKGSKSISVVRFDGPLYFANAGYFEEKVMNLVAEKKKLKFLVIDLEWMSNIDSSGHEVLEKLIYRMDKENIKIYLSGIRVNILESFTKVGFIKNLGKQRIYKNVGAVLDHIEEKYGKKYKVKNIEHYSPDKKKKVDLDKKVIKQIKKIS